MVSSDDQKFLTPGLTRWTLRVMRLEPCESLGLMRRHLRRQSWRHGHVQHLFHVLEPTERPKARASLWPLLPRKQLPLAPACEDVDEGGYPEQP
mmetsp:Transcript_8304/g.15483  ORF Transcript_8304/g.15483 Transcript_8304/m.15483 type:complete len:94 (-) Transcript_8304:16-297(-)